MPATAATATARGRRSLCLQADREVDDDVAGLTLDVFDTDLIAVALLDLAEQGQGVVVVDEAHRFAVLERLEGTEDGSVAEALGHAARVEGIGGSVEHRALFHGLVDRNGGRGLRPAGAASQSYGFVRAKTLSQSKIRHAGGNWARALVECCPSNQHFPSRSSTMIESLLRRHAGILALAALLGLSGCGYNDFQRLDEQTKSAWAEVVNQYQRRADLIPNLVATVKGEANFEQETLTRVIEARSRATAIQVTPQTLDDPQAMQRFQQAQGELGGALSRLLAVAESYPNLKANQGFQDLRVQLEGTENRVTVARNKYIAAVQEYNVLARSFPSNLTAMIFSYAPKSGFTVTNEAEISRPPTVDFGTQGAR